MTFWSSCNHNVIPSDCTIMNGMLEGVTFIFLGFSLIALGIIVINLYFWFKIKKEPTK